LEDNAYTKLAGGSGFEAQTTPKLPPAAYWLGNSRSVTQRRRAHRQIAVLKGQTRSPAEKPTDGSTIERRVESDEPFFRYERWVPPSRCG
jgi:hypothetical protein